MVAALLGTVWVLAVAAIVLWPTPVDQAAGGAVRLVVASLHGRGLPVDVSYGVVESVANVLMFIPLGFLWFILTPRGWRWAGPLAGLGLSILIEATQSALLPERVATPWDVLANTAGTLCGTLAAWMLMRAYHG